MKLRTAMTATVMICATAMTLAQGPRRDGKWEVTMEMDMPGMPMKMPPVVTTQCVTKEDVDDPQKALPKGPAGRGNDNCKVSDYKMEGNKVTWTMKCEGKQPMSGSGEMVYGDEKYTGAIKMDMNGSTMTMKYAGKRVGDCQK